MSLTIEEQEVHINFTRDNEYATLYTSDNTWITKMDKLVKKSQGLYSVIKETEYGKTYKFPKRLVTLRSSIMTREISEEQKKAASERFNKMWAEKKANKGD